MHTQLLVFTDLDGTLLDHDSYSWLPAATALARLAEANIPLIFNSSKTTAEIASLRTELHNKHPYIVENGGAVCIPENYFATGPEQHKLFGFPYAEIIDLLYSLRRQRNYRFEGFADLGTDGVMAATGLDRESATQARQRLCSEPLLWQGSDAERELFRRDLDRHGLQLVRGGRFWHVMGQSDKGQAMGWLVEHYRQHAPQTRFTTVALGDGPNDLPMLAAANIAVTIKPHTGAPLKLPGHPRVLVPDQPGPAGWQQALEQLLN